MLGGYVGKISRVNLSQKTLRDESLPDESVLGKFIGGLGLGIWMLN